MTYRTHASCIAALASVLMGASADESRAQTMIDRVYRQNGVDSGQIVGVTPLEVTISKNGVESKVASEDIEAVYLAGEPAELNSVRTALRAGRLADAKRIIDGIDPADAPREEVQAEIDFYRMLVGAQLALSSEGSLQDATAGARDFSTRRRTSFHVPQAIEMLGDLLLAGEDYAGARAEYAKLAKARSEYLALRSALLLGRAWQAEGKYAEAIAEFDKVMGSSQRGARIDPLKASAALDLAISQAATGKAEEAAATIGAIIDKADAEDAATLGRAYNALGECYLKAGNEEGALYAFLYVDLLYNDAADSHAKALHELVALWRKNGSDSRSQEAAQKLAEKYPGSRWAKAR
jgi:tetratricopeptide (TPR) repeat protein